MLGKTNTNFCTRSREFPINVCPRIRGVDKGIVGRPRLLREPREAVGGDVVVKVLADAGEISLDRYLERRESRNAQFALIFFLKYLAKGLMIQ